MFACTFEEYTGFGNTLVDAWENLRVEMEDYVPEVEPGDCLFFKEIEVEVTPREFDIQELE